MEHRFAARLNVHRPRELPVGELKPAAVLLLLVGDAGAERVIFQLRTQNVRHHKGEISFPGGRLDAADPSFLHAALRETHEEIGVPPEAVTILGALDDVAAVRSQYLIRPYVGVARAGVEAVVAAPREVAGLLDVPLTHLADQQTHLWHAADLDGSIETSLAYGFNGHVIWGVTARILDQFLEVIGEDGV